MTYEPDDLEAALIEGDPEDVIPMDKIRAMARAVRDAGWINGTPIIAELEARMETARDQWLDGQANGYLEAIGIVKGEA